MHDSVCYPVSTSLDTMNEDEVLSGGPPSMTAMQMLVTFSVIALPTAWLVAKYLFATEDKLCNEIIYGDHGFNSRNELARVNSVRWPLELPGLKEIRAYMTLKEQVLREEGYELNSEARARLRHALMDRCQVHVAWLLRFEREQHSIERMARRGMMSEDDFRKFSRFAECLDREVSDVREEAGWLCEDPECNRQASEEIWRVAMQIWQQRRRSDEGLVRRGNANQSLKGLKPGFLSKQVPNTESNRGKELNPSGLGVAKPAYEAVKWPKQLPGKAAIDHYESLKAKFLDDGNNGDGGDYKEQLREALMERCRLQVPWMQQLQQEQLRASAASERARWQSCAVPTARDISMLKQFENKCIAESAKVKEEADWLGNLDGAPGLGDRIWPMAFELLNKSKVRHEEHEQLMREHHESLLKAYAEHAAKPWPSELPGKTQRLSYDQMKAAFIRDAQISTQAALLEGQPASHVIGIPACRQLRAALMARCQQIIPLIQRLQAEGRAFKIASERGQVAEQEAANFMSMESSTKAEISAVKAEAEWLSNDAGTQVDMGNQIWPAAFQLYAKRRAEIARRIQVAQMQCRQTQGMVQPPWCPIVADAVD